MAMLLQEKVRKTSKKLKGNYSQRNLTKPFETFSRLSGIPDAGQSRVSGLLTGVHQAIPLAIATTLRCKRSFAKNFCSENEIFAISFAKQFAIASELIRSASFAALSLRFRGKNLLANFRFASEFAFAFAAVSLRPRCTQPLKGSRHCCSWSEVPPSVSQNCTQTSKSAPCCGCAKR